MNLRIMKTGGLAAHINFDKSNEYNAVLGISIANHYFTKERVGEIARFGVEHFNEFIIVLVDHPERWNWQLRINASQARGEANVKALRESRENAYANELRKLNLSTKAPIRDWSYTMKLKNYDRNLSILNRAFTEDAVFRSGISEQFKQNIGGLLTVREELRGRPFSEAELTTIMNYLLEEIAGFFCIHFDEGYAIDFHHHPSMQIVQRIYNNEFPTITDAMGYDWKAQGWLQVSCNP